MKVRLSLLLDAEKPLVKIQRPLRNTHPWENWNIIKYFQGIYRKMIWASYIHNRPKSVMFVCICIEHIAINAIPFTVVTKFLTKYVRNLTEYAWIYSVYTLLGVMPFSLSGATPLQENDSPMPRSHQLSTALQLWVKAGETLPTLC